MTDNEIIRAMQQCNGWNGRCLNCPLNSEGTNCKEKLNSYALDLINRQKAEIERLKKELELANSDKVIAETHEKAAKEMFVDVIQQLKTAKSEAIKEFSERLKEHACCGRVAVKDIDNLVKEMMEAEE